MLFSQRYGYKPVKNIVQLKGMDEDLRNSLWNAFILYYVGRARETVVTQDKSDFLKVAEALWLDYFKKPLDGISVYAEAIYVELKGYFFNICTWHEVYDFIEFVANHYKGKLQNKEFIQYCNSILERELSGYRFVGGTIAPITGEEEITEIEEALKSTDSLKPVAIHLKTALDSMSDRKSPDYRNSIKESISAVEAICKLIAGSDEAKFGEALKVIKEKIGLHPALEKAFGAIYGYTSNAEGIRHALLDEPHLYFEDAKFMLVACASFINYMKLKSSRAGIEF